MQRNLPKYTTCIFIVSVLLLVTTIASLAQEETEEPPGYVGSGECLFCHEKLEDHYEETTHFLTLRNTRRYDEDILGDFSVGEDIRTVQFPEEETPRPFAQEDIAYILGSGEHVQRYVYAPGRGVYLVFPAEWNTITQAWQPYDRGEWNLENYDFIENCAYCHTTGLNTEDLYWEEDAVTCETCHGPGEVHADYMFDFDLNISAEIRSEMEGTVVRAIDSQTCGQCHSTGMNPDGNLYPSNYYAGGTLLTADSFALVAIDDVDHWWANGYAAHPQMEFNEWVTSAHANALTTANESEYFSAECLSCHSAAYPYAHQLALREAEDGEFPIPGTIQQILSQAAFDPIELSETVDELLPILLTALGIETVPESYSDGWHILYDELGIEPGNRAAMNTLPDILPELLLALNELEDQQSLIDQLLPLAMAQASTRATNASDTSLDLTVYGVTCSSCHGAHNPDTVGSDLLTEEYPLCTSCHTDRLIDDGIHHPAQQIFEGESLLEQLLDMPGAHFTAEDGPTCVTCHMSAIPTEPGQFVSHTLQPLLPQEASTIEGLEDGCTNCHGDTASQLALQRLIDDIQSNTAERITIARNTVTETTPSWVSAALDIIEGDGSSGLHNPALVQHSLVRVEQTLGLRSLGFVDDELGALVNDLLANGNVVPQQGENIPSASPPGRLTLPSIIILVLSGLIIVVAGIAFFRGQTDD